MNVAKLTSKYQATIPKEVRSILHLKAGDQIIYEIASEDTVTLRKASPIDIEYLRSLESTLSEWNSESDDEAYKDL